MRFLFYITLFSLPLCGFSQTDSVTMDVVVTIRNEYNKVVDKADQLFDVKDYAASLKLYERAHSLDPADKEVIAKIIKVKELLDPNCYGKNAYEKVICKADALYASKDYRDAIQFYNRASMLNPSESYPAEMIENINRILKDD